MSKGWSHVLLVVLNELSIRNLSDIDYIIYCHEMFGNSLIHSNLRSLRRKTL